MEKLAAAVADYREIVLKAEQAATQGAPLNLKVCNDLQCRLRHTPTKLEVVWHIIIF